MKNNNKTPKTKIVKKPKDVETSKIRLFQFKITLDGSSPKIWRRILVPADYTFFDLHSAIQDAMSGWLDYHLHCFYISQKGTARPISIKFPNPKESMLYEDDYLDERKQKISDYFGVKIKQCKYCYDFGDNWDHTILFEREITGNSKEDYPRCIAGENKCPPEDCGGVWGYKDLQEILKNPRHPEYKDRLEWLEIGSPKHFEPTDFDTREVQFEDIKERLEYYEDQFGVESLDKNMLKGKNKNKKEKYGFESSNLDFIDDDFEDFDDLEELDGKIISPYHNQPQKKDLSTEIKRLAGKNFSKMGVWEIAQRSNKISGMVFPFGGAKSILNVIVHRDSYFVLSMGISLVGDIEKFKEIFLESIEKNKSVPDVLHTDDLKLADYLKEIAEAFGFEIKKEKLKVVPVILRDMGRLF